MMLTAENSKGKKILVYDVGGSLIPGVLSFDTETCDIEMVVWLAQREGDNVRPVLKALDSSGAQGIATATARIPGAYAIVDGQKV